MLRSFSVLLFCVFFAFGCNKDDESTIIIEYLVEINGAFELTVIDRAPDYIDGGAEELSVSVAKKVLYPSEARENGVEGKVGLEYEISPLGEVENIAPITNLGSGCEEALIEAFKACTQGIAFSPAELNGEAVRVKDTFCLTFNLE